MSSNENILWCETHRRESPALAHCDAPQYIGSEPCIVVARLLLTPGRDT